MGDRLKHNLDELRQVVPEAFDGNELFDSLLEIIDRHLKPLPSQEAQSDRITRLLSRYCNSLKRRGPLKRPKTRPGVFRSLSAFITRDLRSLAKEYADFEAKAEKAVIENPAMHLTGRGASVHKERALNLLDRFMLIVAQQWEQLGAFKTRLQTLENQYYDRDCWALHLHDRLNRLANLLTTVDSTVTSLKRALLNDKPHENAVEALRALRDNSLNPLEFISKVFADNDKGCEINVAPPQPPLTYSNHFMLREVLLELVHNAIAAGATEIRAYVTPTDRGTARLYVEDNCPGGIPPAILSKLGKERIISGTDFRDEMDLYNEHLPKGGWGLYTVINNLIPRLGSTAAIDFQSPLNQGNGTRVTLTVPTVDKGGIKISKPSVVRRNGLPFHASAFMDPLGTGGSAFFTHAMIARIIM